MKQLLSTAESAVFRLSKALSKKPVDVPQIEMVTAELQEAVAKVGGEMRNEFKR